MTDRRKIRFLLAGGIGLIADGLVLAVLTRVSAVDPLIARILSIAVALFVTWQFNRHVTFGPGRHGLAMEAVRYGGVGIAGSMLNYSIYSAVLLFAPSVEPLLALAGASIAVTIFSWLGYSRLVFAR